jgi:hypothetical protein
MNRISAKVTQKIRVLLEDDDVYTSAREKVARNHARGTAADDAAAAVGILRGVAGAIRLQRLLHNAPANTNPMIVEAIGSYD